MNTKRKFRLKEELPNLIRKYKTFSPTELKRFILQDFNKDLTDKSIIMCMSPKRDKEGVFKALHEELSNAAQSQIVVTKDIFKNGNFEEIPAVKAWIAEKKGLVSPNYLQSHVGALKRICQGTFSTKDPLTKLNTEHHLEGWEPKHPERLTVEQFNQFKNAVQDAGCCTNNYRVAFRDFWLSYTGKTLKPSEVSGEVTTGTTHKIGRWKNVDVAKAKLDLIFEKLKAYNFQAYAAVFTAYKTASRHSAVLTEYLESKVRYDGEGTATLEVTDKGFHRKGRLSFTKLISSDLLVVLKECWKKYGNNPFNGLDDLGMMNKLKEIYKEVLAEDFDTDGVTPKPYSALELALSSPFHFWRHMFGRKMLEATDYNYSVVAELGSWSDEAMLHKVYGAAPMKMLIKAGIKALPLI